MAPLDVESAPAISIGVDGDVIDHFVPREREFERHYIINGGGKSHIVTIDVSNTINPGLSRLSHDPRDLGLKIHSVLWGATD
jgi:hypothetical protein